MIATARTLANTSRGKPVFHSSERSSGLPPTLTHQTCSRDGPITSTTLPCPSNSQNATRPQKPPGCPELFSFVTLSTRPSAVNLTEVVMCCPSPTLSSCCNFDGWSQTRSLTGRPGTARSPNNSPYSCPSIIELTTKSNPLARADSA